jgi:hypothetical protein
MERLRIVCRNRRCARRDSEDLRRGLKGPRNFDPRGLLARWCIEASSYQRSQRLNGLSDREDVEMGEVGGELIGLSMNVEANSTGVEVGDRVSCLRMAPLIEMTSEQDNFNRRPG